MAPLNCRYKILFIWKYKRTSVMSFYFTKRSTILNSGYLVFIYTITAIFPSNAREKRYCCMFWLFLPWCPQTRYQNLIHPSHHILLHLFPRKFRTFKHKSQLKNIYTRYLHPIFNQTNMESARFYPDLNHLHIRSFDFKLRTWKTWIDWKARSPCIPLISILIRWWLHDLHSQMAIPSWLWLL